MDKIVVTRHVNLIKYLQEVEGITATQIITHANEDDVRDKIVIGILPLHLASLATEIWEVPINVPLELRGIELSVEQLKEFAQPMQKYIVRKIDK